MKNKFRKIKYLISFLLAISMVTPLYASLSASDGSAFVTKTEFDSAIADFNARLTTFEAGINSKIDSQVTSYLERNGIWSGAKQVIENTDLNIFGVKLTGQVWYSYYNNDVGGTYGCNTTGNYWAFNSNFNDNGDGTGIILIDKCTKSGLCTLIYNRTYGPCQDKATWTSMQTAVGRTTNSFVTGDQFGLTYKTQFSIYMKPRNQAGTAFDGAEELMYVDAVDQTYPFPGKISTVSVNNICAYFFVKKNSQIYCTTNSISQFRNIGGYSAIKYLATYYNSFSSTIY